jgi:hypothetical protein
MVGALSEVREALRGDPKMLAVTGKWGGAHENVRGSYQYVDLPAAVLGGAAAITGTAALLLNQWSHLAVTLSGSTGTLYVNGTAVARNASMTLDPSVRPFGDASGRGLTAILRRTWGGPSHPRRQRPVRQPVRRHDAELDRPGRDRHPEHRLSARTGLHNHCRARRRHIRDEVARAVLGDRRIRGPSTAAR